MRERKKQFRFVLLALATAACLQGCQTDRTPSGDTDNGNSVTVQAESETAEPMPFETYLVTDGSCEYTVVYDLSSKEAKTAANRLAQYFKTKFKVTLKVCSSDEVVYNAYAKEIYIGNTGFTESVEAAEALLSMQSCCITKIGNKIVMVAGSDSILSDRMNTYIEEVIPKGTSFDTSTGKATVLFTEYLDNVAAAHTKITVGDVDLKEFTIVYEDDDEGLYEEFATYLRDTVLSSYGVVLPLVSDKTAPVAHELLIGNTNRTETQVFRDANGIQPLGYDMGIQDGKYVITGSGAYPVRLAVQRFASKYLLAISKEVTVPVGEILSKDYFSGTVEHSNGSDARVMTLNMMAEYYAATSYGDGALIPRLRFEVFEAILAAYSPSVVGMQECSPLWRSILAEKLDPDIWGIIDPGKEDGSNGETIIVYNKQRVTLLDGGSISYPEYAETSRIVYGHFRLVSDSAKEFFLFNTHWSWKNDAVADMEMEYLASRVKEMRAANGNIPAFCTGDFNTPWHSERHLAFCTNSGLVDSFDTAKANGKTVNEICGYGNPGDESRKNTFYTTVVDHVFCPSDTAVHRFETVIDNRFVDLSDHAPRYADLSW